MSGQDVNSILTRLLYAADMSLAYAAIGIVCLDEFDKLASGQNSAVFSGAGTTKDVSGLGVQRELLKMLESIEIPVPLEYTHSDYAPEGGHVHAGRRVRRLRRLLGPQGHDRADGERAHRLRPLPALRASRRGSRSPIPRKTSCWRATS